MKNWEQFSDNSQKILKGWLPYLNIVHPSTAEKVKIIKQNLKFKLIKKDAGAFFYIPYFITTFCELPKPVTPKEKIKIVIKSSTKKFAKRLNVNYKKIEYDPELTLNMIKVCSFRNKFLLRLTFEKGVVYF